MSYKHYEANRGKTVTATNLLQFFYEFFIGIIVRVFSRKVEKE